MVKINRTTIFYTSLIVLGFGLLLVDLTPGHNLTGHINLFKKDPDILGGVILLFFGGFGLGRTIE